MRRRLLPFVLIASATVGCSTRDRTYDPCAGKATGDECTLCAPDDADCVETRNIKTCDARGACGGHPSDGGAPTDAGAADPASSSAESGERGRSGGQCFAGSDVSESACRAACAAYPGCSLPGAGECGDSCQAGGVNRRITHECAARSDGDCAALRQCILCSLGCTQASKCPAPASADACCNGCASKPSCYDPNASLCDGIARCSE